MTGLLRSELRRLFARRAVRVLCAAALLLVVIVQVRAFLVSDRNVEAAHRRAEKQAEQQRTLGDEGLRGAIASCEKARAEGQLPPDARCPTVEDFQPQSADALYEDPRLHAAKYLRDGARGVAGAFAMLGFIIGATFVGAEWHAGTMQALLLWEPRRLRVLAAKAAALVLGLVAITAAFQALVYGSLLLIGSTRGTTEGVTAGLQMSALLTVARGMIVVSAAGLLGFAVAGLARVTAAALGVAFGYFVIVENLLRGLRPGWQRFLFSENVSAVLLKELQVSPAHARHLDEISGFSGQYTLHAVRGTLTLALYLAILLGVFAYTFTRRDVT